MKTICINGAPLLKKITGIERYLIENLRRIDELNKDNKIRIDLLIPSSDTNLLPEYSNINIVQLKSPGNRLKFSEIGRYLKQNNGVYVSLTSNFCVKKGGIVCLHDIRPIVHKEYDPFSNRLKYRILTELIKANAELIVTVSENSKREICDRLNLSDDKVIVSVEGWEHIKEIASDNSIFEEITSIVKGEYYYSLSSRAPHKNFKWVEEVAKNNRNDTFVVGGKKWDNNDKSMSLDNVIYLGYISDELNKALMQNCKAFLHPSKYEGFGLTPLEALACGAKVCVSNVSCLPEIFGDCVHYFDPDDYEVDIDNLLKEHVKPPDKLLEKYSWDKSAQMWYDILMSICS